MTVLGRDRPLRAHLRRWMKPRPRRSAGSSGRPARRSVRNRVGVVGVIVAVELSGQPGAGAAGHRDRRRQPRLSSSPPNTRRAPAKFLRELLAEVFPADRVAVAHGGADVGAAFSALPFDHLLFTGSTAVGRKVMAARRAEPDAGDAGARRQVAGDRRARISRSSRPPRALATGKWFNAGQTCIAPDYVLVAAAAPRCPGRRAAAHRCSARYGDLRRCRRLHAHHQRRPVRAPARLAGRRARTRRARCCHWWRPGTRPARTPDRADPGARTGDDAR